MSCMAVWLTPDKVQSLLTAIFSFSQLRNCGADCHRHTEQYAVRWIYQVDFAKFTWPIMDYVLYPKGETIFYKGIMPSEKVLDFPVDTKHNPS